MTESPTPHAPAAALPYGRQWIDDDDVKVVAACLRGDWLTQGPRVEQFEASLCAATGARFAVAVSSGTAALHLAALAAGVLPGDTGITSVITFVASANAIAYCGGTPFFADVEHDTALIDTGALEEVANALTWAGKPPRVLVPVDMAGQPADLPAVKALADRIGAAVIEDAAHALGATYSHRGHEYRAASCAHTDMATLSFHPVKTITTGEGGAVTTNDARLAQRLRELRSHGIHRDPARLSRPDEGPWYYEQCELGFNYRLTDLQCALGLSQAAKLPAFLRRRREIARMYDAAFAGPAFAEWLRPLGRRPGTTHAFHLYVVQLFPQAGETDDAVAQRRRAVFLELRERGIVPQVHYIPVHRQPYYANRRDLLVPQNCPNAERYYRGCLSLPMFARMSDADVERVVAALADCRN